MAVTASSAPRTVSILGSTGSVGENTIDLIRRAPDQYRIVALTAHKNAHKLAQQALILKPAFVAIGDEAGYGVLKDLLHGTGVRLGAGAEALCEAGAMDANWVMASIVGAAGLKPTLAAVRRGGVVALANKECLVSAGDLFMREVARHKATLLPVDSEHNAIFQVFDFHQPEQVRRIILTASGGPFRTWTRAQMSHAVPAQAVAHPNWSMGAKISVDSATMMNKGLELIEAHHLFGLSSERIDILVHPQSVVHSMVEYSDGSVLAQMASPDMRTPIAFALGWPARIAAPAERLDLARVGTLTFEAPDTTKFPALRLARAALTSGGAAPTILNAANETAVSRYLAGEIGFLDIAATVEHTLEQLPRASMATLDDILAIDAEARRVAADVKRMSRAAE
jgi:1-deoxy-D-xylulose-5-phosphate reductoisomerase